MAARGDSRRAAAARGAVYLLLTLLVWGLFALDRGFLQDEPWQLTAAREHVAAFLGFLWPGHATLRQTPLRPLQGLQASLAMLSPCPRLAWQLFYGAVWLGSGLLAARFVRLVAPGRPLAAFAAATLTLTACGDHSVNSLSYFVNYSSSAALLWALCAAVAWVQGGRRRSLVGAALLLLFGLFSYDGLVAGAVAAPLVLAGLPLGADPAARARRWRAVAAWATLAGLYAVAFVALSLRAESYTQRVVSAATPGELARRVLGLFAFNFSPWRWPGLFVRPEDGTRPEALPALVLLGLTLAGCAAVLVVGRALAQSAAPEPAQRRLWPAAGTCLATAFVANAGAALIIDWPYRSQAVSRLFVSVALALLVQELASGLARAGRTGLARRAWLVCLPFVAGGIWAGLCSQDLYLTLWRRHRVELRSILDQVPNLRPGARLLLYLPREAPFTSLHYLVAAATWPAYLYGDLKVSTVIWSAGGFDCQAGGQAFTCRNPARADCYASGRCQPLVLPFESTVLLRYLPATGRFVLQRSLPRDLAPEAAGRYDPGDWIVSGPRSRWARELLDQPELLGALFPGPVRGLEKR